MNVTRRETLTTMAAGAASLMIAEGLAHAQKHPAPAAGKPGEKEGGGGARGPVPLPFDPKKLRGISEKLIVSHHDNNYVGAIKGLAGVQKELAKVTKETPPFLVHGLRERELLFSNSIILHEHYFGGLGGDGKPAGEIAKAIGGAFGSLGRWEELFRATGMALAGGSGWVVLDYNHHTGALGTYWSGQHTQALAFGQPLLVMDMYEHAFQMDYGAAAPKYIDAYFTNVSWAAVEKRYARAVKAAKILRG
jgi:superoxide dismutase, Fe-Mn family